MTDKLAYSVAEAAEALGVSKETIYEMIRQRKIPFKRLGTRVIIPKPALVKWLETAADEVAREEAVPEHVIPFRRG